MTNNEQRKVPEPTCGICDEPMKYKVMGEVEAFECQECGLTLVIAYKPIRFRR